MTDFHLIPSSSDDGTLRGLLCGGFLASLISGIMMRDGRCSYRTYSLGEKNRPMPTMALLALLVSEIDMLYMGRAGLPGVHFKAVQALHQIGELGEAEVARVEVGLLFD